VVFCVMPVKGMTSTQRRLVVSSVALSQIFFIPPLLSLSILFHFERSTQVLF
jgi:hypothetical protein